MNKVLLSVERNARKSWALLRSEKGDGVVGYVLILAFIAAVAGATLPAIKTTIISLNTAANTALYSVGK